MLESFESDDVDPDIDGAAAVATIGWGQAVAQEDDLLLWNLSSVLDLHELGLASSHDFGIAGPPASMADLAPIFAPFAFETLEGKIESAIGQLSSLHGQLVAHNPSYHNEFDKDLVKLALSARTVIMFSVVYFQQSHRYISLVHRPSFGSQDTSVTLLVAVAFAGSTRSPPNEKVMCVRNLARLLEEYVFRRLEHLVVDVHSSDRSRELLETLEAAILVYQIQFMSNTAVTLQRTRAIRLPALVSAVRKLGLFAAAHETGTDWLQFVETESCIRIAYWTAMADWTHASMLYMPPQVSVGEMTGNMPCSLDIWNARNAADLVKLIQLQDISSHKESVRDCIQSLTQKTSLRAEFSLSGRHFSISDLMIVIIGLSSVVISADLSMTIYQTAPTLLNAVVRWKGLWKESLRRLSSEAIKKSGIERYSHEYAKLTQRVIEIVASGEPRPPYLRRIGHDTVADFHEFLLQYCMDPVS